MAVGPIKHFIRRLAGDVRLPPAMRVLTPAAALIILNSNYPPRRIPERVQRGYFYAWVTVMDEPIRKRAVSFFDGQNLFHHAKAAFGHGHPNYDPMKLADAVCREHGWVNNGVRFYTGIPDPKRDPDQYEYWRLRFIAMGHAGISVTSRTLRYQIRGGQVISRSEKGIDLRIGLDVVSLARDGQLDVAVIFSQDQDLSEVADEIRAISRSEGRWLKIVSVFPDSPTATAGRGINKTDWFRIDRAFYDACLDPQDYRPAR